MGSSLEINVITLGIFTKLFFENTAPHLISEGRLKDNIQDEILLSTSYHRFGEYLLCDGSLKNA